MYGKPATQDAIQLFHEGAVALAQIEANGFRIDLDYLNKTIADTKKRMSVLKSELYDDPIWDTWHRRFGDRAKLSNRQQLGIVMFGDKKDDETKKKKRRLLHEERFKGLGYKRKSTHKIKGNKSGWQDEREIVDEIDKISNDQAAFEGIDLPFIGKYFELAKLDKTLGTYLMGIRREVCDDRLHAFFGLNIARSYRGNCEMPNLQNIPIRNPEMKKIIRPCFIASKNHVVVEIDFSGAEVRVSACYNRDPNLINYLKDPTTDMHRDTAKDLFFLDEHEVDKKTTRDCAKNMFVFPEFYGSVFFNCARDIWESMHLRKFKVAGSDELVIDRLKKKKITRLGNTESLYGTGRVKGESGRIKSEKGTFVDHVREVESDFWNNRFVVYKQWKDKFFRDYQRRGYYDTKTGFHVEGLWRKNDVTNYPIQGSSFHCLLWCLIQMQKRVMKYRMRSKIVGQIHDSIIADVHVKELKTFLEWAVDIMTVRLMKHYPWLIVQMEIEADVAPRGMSWYDKQEVDLHNISGIVV